MILVVNAGSSSVKIALFDGKRQVLAGAVTAIGGASVLHLEGRTRMQTLPDAAEALAALLAEMDGISGLTAAAHRVVHGGATLTAACRLTHDVMARIEAAIPLAPLHNPANLAGIRALQTLAPDLPQFASFDTAFHATNPQVARRYAIPEAAEALGIRRYGFHGISCSGVVARYREWTGEDLPERLLILHLGNGASLTAVRSGRSVATTMGYSPLEGLTMGTRAGGIDGSAVLRIAEVFGIDRARRMLNEESGLLALGGASDMATLARQDTARTRFARDHFAYWAVRHAGSMIAAMAGVDALAFTGGIGEHDAEMCSRIMAGLAFSGLRAAKETNDANAARLHAEGSPIAAWIIPAAEEVTIAQDAQAVMARETEYSAVVRGDNKPD